MRAMWLVLVLTLVGCKGIGGADGKDGEQGPQGPAGEVGSTGPPGERGEAGPRGEAGTSRPFFVYVDADGKEVPTDLSLLWPDDAGRLWLIDAETATVGPTVSPNLGLLYADESCAGAPHVIQAEHAYLKPRYVVLIDGMYWGREDSGTFAPFVTLSVGLSGGGCRATPGPMAVLAVPVGPLPGVTPPAFPYRAPLHLERR